MHDAAAAAAAAAAIAAAAAAAAAVEMPSVNKQEKRTFLNKLLTMSHKP